MFKFKTFQRQDLARGALHDGLIPALDTGLGKSIYGFAWALLKTGWTVVPRTESRLPSLTRHLNPEKPTGIRPNAPVLLIVPGDLHQQIALEGWEKFRVDTRVLDSQDAFQRLNRVGDSLQPNLDAEGKPVLPPDFYITSYSQLTTNGVTRLPDPLDWPKPRELLAFSCLPERLRDGGDLQREPLDERPETFRTAAEVFTWRDRVWRDDYDLLQVHKDDTRPDLDRAFLRERDLLSTWEDPKAAANALRKLEAATDRLQNLFTYRACPQYAELTLGQQDFVIREFADGHDGAAAIQSLRSRDVQTGHGESGPGDVVPGAPGLNQLHEFPKTSRHNGGCRGAVVSAVRAMLQRGFVQGCGASAGRFCRQAKGARTAGIRKAGREISPTMRRTRRMFVPGLRGSSDSMPGIRMRVAQVRGRG